MSQKCQQDHVLRGLGAGGMKQDFHSKDHGQATDILSERAILKLRGQHPEALKEASRVFDMGAGKLVTTDEFNQNPTLPSVSKFPALSKFPPLSTPFLTKQISPWFAECSHVKSVLPTPAFEFIPNTPGCHLWIPC